MTNIVLDKQQQNMHDTIIDWYTSNDRSPYIVCSGFAGSGKTTILGEVLKTFGQLEVKVSCATFTGKASHVLIKKIQGKPFNYCGTIHGLIYKPKLDKDGVLIGFKKNFNIETDLIIIDECSMIDKDMFDDLLDFQIPILFIGDNAQLPPVSKNKFDIFKNTAAKLTQIHRQAEKSMIIQLSMMVRNGETIPQGYGGNCARYEWMEDKEAREAIYNHDYKSDEIILCGLNSTRVRLNKLVRKNNGIKDKFPIKGEKLVCLQNNQTLGVMNGQLGFIDRIEQFPHNNFSYRMIMSFSDRQTDHVVYSKGFNVINQKPYWKAARTSGLKNKLKSMGYSKLDNFDFGYCLSVHKSQGSQWNSVILINERNSYQSDDDYRKWLYTGITRAESKLIIIDGF